MLKIKSCIVKKYKPASSSKKVNSEGKENLLNQEFEAAKMSLFEFIDGWYNRKRIHSAIGYQIPYDIEKCQHKNYTLLCPKT